jgi:hypothetical protein
MASGVARVGRIDIRQDVDPDQPILIGDRTRLEAPMAFQVVGAGAQLAAAEVEDRATALDAAAHQRPTHQIVGGQGPGIGVAACPVRHHAVAVEIAEDARDGAGALIDGQDLAVVAEHLQHLFEQSPRHGGRAVITHCAREQRVEGLQRGFDLHLKVPRQRLAHHGALVLGNLLEVLFHARGDGAVERGVDAVLRRPTRRGVRSVAKFDVVNAKIAPEALDLVEQLGPGIGV